MRLSRCPTASASVLAVLAPSWTAHAAVGVAAAQEAVVVDARAAPARASSALEPLRIERGEGRLPLFVQRDEVLVYEATLDLGLLGSPSVGTVTLSSSVSPLNAAAEEQAVLAARAVGGYAAYEVDRRIVATHRPQAFPRTLLRETQSGTENRRRELSLGRQEAHFVSIYRRDGHCGGCNDRRHFVEPTWAWEDEHHCKRCKRAEHRTWRAPEVRDVPEDAVDMLTSVFLARSVLLQSLSEASFPLIDKKRLWNVRLARGERKRIETPAGEFDAVEILLSSSVPPGEPGREADFEGLFGIHGEISICVEARSGVPVSIRGAAPIGPFDLDLSVTLAEYRGTPAEFRPLTRAAEPRTHR